MLTPPTQLHDAFFKSFMSKPELAGRFLREHLPSDVAELLAQEPPEQVPGTTPPSAPDNTRSTARPAPRPYPPHQSF